MKYHPVCRAAAAVLALPLLSLAGNEATNTAFSAAEPMVVTATRLSLDPIEQPYAFYRHDRQELGSSVGSSALDRMDYGPGVIIQHTAPGQTSPYIRGLTGRQSLLLFDGVRLSHATMRGGPNEYSALIPDMSIDSIDAILGSSSVVNGSDGLTGALDLRLESPGRGVGKPVSPWVSTRMDSANGVQMGTGVDGKSGDWRYSIEGSFLDFHDRVGGKDAADNIFGNSKGDSDRIPNTAYDQSAFAARAAYDGFMDRSIGIALGRTRQDDARRPDGYFQNSGDANRISRTYDPETFTYLHLRDKWTPDGLFFDKLTTTAWWHQFDENQQREDLTGGKYRRREFDDRIDSIGVEPQATSQIGSHELTYGVFTLFERTRNDYREYRNPTGTEAAGAAPYKQADWSEKTTITDGAQYNTYAIYAQDLWQFAEQWSLLSGLRYTYVDWDFDVASGNADDLTGSLRTSWQFREDMLTFVGVSKAFRAPNLSDLDGATDRASSGNINVGNPELDPELGTTVEAGWRYAQGRDQLGASVFHTIIEDVIQTVYPSGGGDGMSDNGESAYLQGVELLWDYGLPLAIGLGNRLALVGSISLVDSEEEVPQPDGSILDRPISRANRLYGLAGLRYEITRNWWTKVQVRFSDAYGRDDVTADDATDVRLTVPGSADGTIPGFGVLDLAGGWISNGGGRWMSLVLENLADKTYRQLGSGADAPGFNIGLNAGVRF
jgi:outer membrane receptor protein involved in Fe transport